MTGLLEHRTQPLKSKDRGVSGSVDGDSSPVQCPIDPGGVALQLGDQMVDLTAKADRMAEPSRRPLTPDPPGNVMWPRSSRRSSEIVIGTRVAVMSRPSCRSRLRLHVQQDACQHHTDSGRSGKPGEFGGCQLEQPQPDGPRFAWRLRVSGAGPGATRATSSGDESCACHYIPMGHHPLTGVAVRHFPVVPSYPQVPPRGSSNFACGPALDRVISARVTSGTSYLPLLLTRHHRRSGGRCARARLSSTFSLSGSGNAGL